MNGIPISAGAGGEASRRLAEEIIFPILGGENINGNDASVLDLSGKAAISTDSFVISPLFFGSKSIGTIAAAGSINDVLTCGAVPKYLTAALIIEQGFSRDSLVKILTDLRREADKNNVVVAAGDTKVVPKGECDGLFINTSAVGICGQNILSPGKISAGDSIIVTGTLGDHETALMLYRNKLSVEADIESDAAGLTELILPYLKEFPDTHAMRDPTRGGIAATLNELAVQSGCSFEIEEGALPVKPAVRSFCRIMGLDITALANEGKMLIFVPQCRERAAVEFLRGMPHGKAAAVIGKVVDNNGSRVILKTEIADRILPMPSMEQVPRIC